MTKFAFLRRSSVEQEIFVEADSETDAWTRALAGEIDGHGAPPTMPREPTFRRLPDQDVYDL